MRSHHFLFVFFICISLHTTAQENIKRLDSFFTSLYQKGDFNGNVLVAERGVTVYKKSFGLANETTKELLNENSIFELGSVSKQFTAMAIAILNKQGKLHYDDPISKTIPELSFYKSVTIRNLLNHVSGLPDYMSLFDSVWDKNKIAVNDDIIRLFVEYKPPVHFSPGSKYEYSNTGYALLATIIERVSKKSYEKFLQENIFKPLHMKHSLVYTRRYRPLRVKNYALGYVYDSSGHKILPDSVARYNMVYFLDGIHGDGTVNSTVNDLLLWDRALYTTKLLSKKEMKELFTPALLGDNKSTNYGFGWMTDSSKQFGSIVFHSGGWPGYASYIERNVDRDLTIIILRNIDTGRLPVNMIRNILYNRGLD
jgi:CubicO group peptidase (beta-lactamase class C family)